MERPNLVFAATLPSLFAGPIFAAALVLAGLYLELPRPVPIDPRGVAMMPLALLLAAVLGFLPALIMNLAFAAAMTLLARLGGPARSRAFWLAAGAGMGGLLVLLFGASGSAAAALVATSAGCASMVWTGLQDAWVAPA